jgi:O-antigen/teichoic acid export membrane protein
MKTHRQIFRSSAVTGSASIINISVTIIKVKVLAVLLGPAGVGIMGIYQNIMNISSTIAGCGLGSSGVRQLAGTAGDADTVGIVRRALWIANLMLGFAGMVALWLLRRPVAEIVFGNAAHAREIGWLGLGLFLSLLASAQTALLQGLRRISDLARVNIMSAVMGTAVGIVAVYLLGERGVVWFVLTAPAASILVAVSYTRSLPKSQLPYDWYVMQRQWQAMLKAGIPFMAAEILNLATQLAARSFVFRQLGIDASGYFQASWSISMVYLGFVLGAMGVDYYPRLTEAINDHERSRQLVNEQTEMALLLASPVLLAMLTLAPWVIHLLYAENFAPAADLLRWQVMGDILKVVSWPMGFIILAQGRGEIYLITQFIWNAVYIGWMALGIHQWGLLTAGIGFWVAYMVLCVVVYGVAVKLIGFKATKRNMIFTLVLFLIGVVIVLISNISSQLAYYAGLAATLAVGVYSLQRLDHLTHLFEWFRKIWKA